MPYPKDFVWGVASASFQVEGASEEDGKGLSIWDMYCRTPGNVFHGHTGDVACDHYHRHREDVKLMKDLGVQGYRFSLSWPRIIPDGNGKVNKKGLDFYDRLVDELLKAGIQPWVTLFHWDYPYELYIKGGWLNPDSPDWFANYTKVAVEKLGDRVGHWMTLNEPLCFIAGGLLQGWHAPGLKLPLRECALAAHNVLLSHGKSVQTIRALSKKPVKIGFAPTGQRPVPYTDKPEDIRAAEEALNNAAASPLMSNSWWMDPVFLGKYPEDGLESVGKFAPKVKSGDMKLISSPVDFCGMNIYSGEYVRRGKDGKPEYVLPPAGYNRTSQDDWFVNPPCMYWVTKWFYKRYKKPIVITENGHQNLDFVHLDGKVHDPQRIDYLHRYLLELEKAIDEGVPVNGYFQWTIMDNFEWAMGYKVRVGLVYTDFQTLDRIPKDSYYWYKKLIASNGKTLHKP
ncbi:MAG TPA: beta-glucosidase [Lentisphaeria bacterium]|nr:MAG: beta-glucosidase [Lentisphaerae bacterium GWF2_49_21]HBC86532.1 beta-glucosidase [Lentisphaeria bacterium]